MQTNSTPILELKNITKHYQFGKQNLRAVDSVNIKIQRGETLGIIGESGSGKSTIGKIVLQLEKETSGDVLYEGKNLKDYSQKQLLQYRKKMQMIFQDPYASLNPRMTIENIIGEGIDIHRLKDRSQNIRKLINEVKLDNSMLDRYPHEFSGGQRQRIGIARALAVEPEFIVCDEPLSALDISTQKHILELLLELKTAKKLTYIFISHDLHAVKAISDTIAVMQSGKIIEYGSASDIFNNPRHEFTKSLLNTH